MPSIPDRRKQIESLIPEGRIVTRKWLSKSARLDEHAIDNLVKSEQLRLLWKGLYTRGTLKITWQQIVSTLQAIAETDFLVGGLTALQLKGYSHYIPGARKETIHLYGNDKWPAWINKLSDDVTFVKHTRRLLFSSMTDSESQQLTTQIPFGEIELSISVPERACLEMLYDVPDRISFEHAEELFQGMTNLSPRILQRLLESCTSIKTKRLFLWLSSRYNYSWATKIDQTRISLGSGNRVLAENGELDKNYLITVPRLDKQG
ncbi:hypothetical protein GCM10007423_00240 [Dyadobacter endophyticus]|uniref:Transcriptional regulator AbiEi antitoxin N-terminal domain-containing protein n=1 Tax=Dyadobacter endophyticus TaxID=1749036 RepID=A0ABQ1YD47_9BACT|nr:type IV toxin-antitoxin system AbiEi family antitoxin [Dyadobacter endophyticus]GGH20081.1 hypothetical protein GCM10007423_00240 [Dyadobacter endophyticus]